MLAARGVRSECADFCARRMKAGDYAGARPELVRASAHPGKAFRSRTARSQGRYVRHRLHHRHTAVPAGRAAASLRYGRSQSRTAPAARCWNRINSAIAQTDANRVEHALKTGDLAGAESAAEDYEATPGASRAEVAQWSQQMWKLVNLQRAHPTRATKSALKGAISALQKENAHAGRMSDDKFRNWVIETATVAGTPMVEVRRSATTAYCG